MDYMTKPLSREKIRKISHYIRQMFGLNQEEPFPVLRILDNITSVFNNVSYEIVEDNKLPANVFAWCYPKPEGGFVIEIKQTVYDEAYQNKNEAFLCFICHELCHVILFYLGYTPISARAIEKNEKMPAYYSVEWQAKALCGELMIPFEATAGMTVNQIIAKYHVSKSAAKYRVQQK